MVFFWVRLVRPRVGSGGSDPGCLAEKLLTNQQDCRARGWSNGLAAGVAAASLPPAMVLRLHCHYEPTEPARRRAAGSSLIGGACGQLRGLFRLRLPDAAFRRRGDAGDPAVHHPIIDRETIRAVERAGLHGLNEGQKIAYEIVADKRTDKSSAENLKPA